MTLVSEDQTQFKAHKIVLSACSPVFKNIIENNPIQHPLIYLRGIQSFEMETVLQFMYLGEGQFYRERLKEFLRVAHDLEVNGISAGMEEQSEEAKETVDELDTIASEEAAPDQHPSEEGKETAEGLGEISTEAAPSLVPSEEAGETVTELDDITGQLTEVKPKRQKKSTKCPDCGRDFKQRCDMLSHYRYKHLGIRIHLDTHIKLSRSNIAIKSYYDYPTFSS